MRRNTSLGRSVSDMPKPHKPDWYWPLADLSRASEVRDYFPDEAEALGVITILWNRQELALRRLYLQIIASKRPDYAAAIWDRQPTHQARRDLLALALHTVKLSKRKQAFLEFIISRTKAVADRRNELLHAEYVVHGRTDVLHAKIKAPRSNKAAKYQRAEVSDLARVISDLEYLLDVTDGAWLEFQSRKGKELQQRLRQFAETLRQSQKSPQSG
jgi:hypothetical protein